MDEKDKIDRLPIASDEERIIISDENDQQNKPGKPRITAGRLVAIILLAAFVIAEIVVFSKDLKGGVSAAQDSYDTAYASEHDKVYDEWYWKYFYLAEEEWHVSNRAAITLGDLHETANLEVLSVSDTEYVILDGDSSNGNVTAWLEVPGTGTYVVDLQAAEFVVDDENSYVLARVPKPELTNVSIDYANVNKLLFEDNDLGGITIFNESIEDGEEYANRMLNEGQRKIERSLYSNQYFYQSAVSAAEDTITFMIKQFNPGRTDLTVEVEFF